MSLKVYKPCPFCGNKYPVKLTVKHTHVHCSNSECPLYFTSMFPEQWNNRYSDISNTDEGSSIQKAMDDHHKHYHALILWLKAHKNHLVVDQNNVDQDNIPIITGDAFDLCHMLSEGSTVAHAIWEKYEDDWRPKPKKGDNHDA